MVRNILGKRSQEQGIVHVSTPSLVIPKRPRRGPRSSHQLKNPATAVKPLSRAWAQFERDVNDALRELRRPALNDISEAISRGSTSGKVPAVCVKMGAAAAAGDRGEAFQVIVNHVKESNGMSVLRLQSAHHSSMGAVTQAFETIAADQPILVAVEDADLFPEDTLKDIVYVSGKRNQASEDGSVIKKSPSLVALIFGLGSSPDSLHSALGIQEATMIVPTSVEMPNATECFKVIVEKVFFARRHAVFFSQEIYDLLEKEFFERECTVATLMRSLHHMYSLHFYQEPLAAIVSEPDSFARLQAAVSERKMEAVISKDISFTLRDCLAHMRDNVQSVQNTLNESPDCSDEQLGHMAVNWILSLENWTKRCQVIELVLYELLLVLQISESGWRRSKSNSHPDLRLRVFREFLVCDENDLRVGANHIVNLIKARINKAGRKLMQDLTNTIIKSIPQASIEADEELADSVARLEELTQTMDAGRQGETAAEIEIVEDTRGRRSRTIAKGGGAALMRRKQALLNIQANDRKANALTAPREKLRSIFEDLLNLVEPLKTLPLYETKLFLESDALQNISGGLGGPAEPRASLFEAMRNPSVTVGSLSDKEEPDLAVAYRLLAEGGRLKNLHDWYSSFSSIRTASAVERDEEGNISDIKDIPQAEMQARFARVCSELEFLGILKYTNRKTDHVLRLVFE